MKIFTNNEQEDAYDFLYVIFEIVNIGFRELFTFEAQYKRQCVMCSNIVIAEFTFLQKQNK